MCKSPLNINSRLVYIFLKMVELVSRFLVIVIEGCSNLLSTWNLWSSTPFLFICMLCNLYFSFGMLEKIAVKLLHRNNLFKRVSQIISLSTFTYLKEADTSFTLRWKLYYVVEEKFIVDIWSNRIFSTLRKSFAIESTQ